MEYNNLNSFDLSYYARRPFPFPIITDDTKNRNATSSVLKEDGEEILAK